MRKVALISCSKDKRSYACEARLLYDKSSLFSKSLTYARKISDEIFVLSAKHGLISLNEVIAPYEETLNGKPQTELAVWKSNIAEMNVTISQRWFEMERRTKVNVIFHR